MSDTSRPALPSARRLPNMFDLAAAALLLGALAYAGSAARGTFGSLEGLDTAPISLDPLRLPEYAARTTLRMFAALLLSLLFTFLYATWAAKSRRAGLILVPLLDVLQSVPILGFLSFTVTFFLGLFPGQVLGAELAAVFAIFTSQAWNMAFSLYQSLRTVPANLVEASQAFRLSAWQRFWRLEVPFAMPGLVSNTMISLSGGWFFVVASEAITVGDTSVRLPGIGSYVATALEARSIGAVGWAILAMLVVILLYDQLLFRPLVAWSAKFRLEATAADNLDDPWMLALLRRTRALRRGGAVLGRALAWVGSRRLAVPATFRARPRGAGPPSRAGDAAFAAAMAALLGFALWRTAQFVSESLSWSDIGTALTLGVWTLLRVALLIGLASLVWVPIGVWIGLRPWLVRRAQPAAQFLAAFPANLFFPVFVVLIVRYDLDPDIWLTPLMVLGVQWYVLFNVMAGAAALPGNLREAARNLRVRGWLRWRRVVLPGILPYYVTGATVASGGCWNASIVAEVASWGETRLQAHGLGAYVAEATAAGDTPRVVLGVAVMSLFVVSLNRTLWEPLYAYATRRLSLG